MTHSFRLISWITLVTFLPASLPLQALAGGGADEANFARPTTVAAQQDKINRLADQLAESLIVTAHLEEQLETRSAHLRGSAERADNERGLITAARDAQMARAQEARESLRGFEQNFHTANVYNFIFGSHFNATTVAVAAAGTAGLFPVIEQLYTNPLSQDVSMIVPLGASAVISYIGAQILTRTFRRFVARPRSQATTQERILEAVRLRLHERGIVVPDTLTTQWVQDMSKRGLFYASVLHNPEFLNLEISNLKAALSNLQVELMEHDLPQQARWAEQTLEALPANFEQSRLLQLESVAVARTRGIPGVQVAAAAHDVLVERAMTEWAQGAANKYLDVRTAVLATLTNAQELGLPAELVAQMHAELIERPVTHSESTNEGLAGASSVTLPDFRFSRNLVLTSPTWRGDGVSDNVREARNRSLPVALQSAELVTLLEALTVEGKTLVIEIESGPRRDTSGLPSLTNVQVSFSIYDFIKPTTPDVVRAAANENTQPSFKGTAQATILLESREMIDPSNARFHEALSGALQGLARKANTARYQRAICNAGLTTPGVPSVRVEVEATNGAVSAPAQVRGQSEEHELEQPRNGRVHHGGIDGF